MPEEILETPQPVQPIEPKPTNWPRMILIAVLGVGLLVGSAYAGYYYGAQQVQQPEKPTPIVSQPTPAPTPTTSVEDKTKDWEVYTNTKYGFEVRYPVSWKVSEKAEVGSAEIVSIENNDFGTIKVNLQPLSGGTDNPNMRFEYETVLLDNHDVILQKYYFNDQLRQKNYGIKIDGNDISILLTPSQGTAFDIFDQILSTFRFLD